MKKLSFLFLTISLFYACTDEILPVSSQGDKQMLEITISSRNGGTANLITNTTEFTPGMPLDILIEPDQDCYAIGIGWTINGGGMDRSFVDNKLDRYGKGSFIYTIYPAENNIKVSVSFIKPYIFN
jgi:hypothetical protein